MDVLWFGVIWWFRGLNVRRSWCTKLEQGCPYVEKTILSESNACGFVNSPERLDTCEDHYAFSEAWTARHPNKSKNCDHCMLFCCLLHWFRSFWRDKLHTQLNISIQVYFNISCKQCILFPVMQLFPPKQKNFLWFHGKFKPNGVSYCNIKSNNPHLTGGEKTSDFMANSQQISIPWHLSRISFDSFLVAYPNPQHGRPSGSSPSTCKVISRAIGLLKIWNPSKAKLQSQ